MNPRIGLLLALVTVIIFFQNCSQFKSGSRDQGTPFKSANNGGSYGGKLSGTFYRFSPDFICENKEAPTAFIEIDESTIRLTNNTGQKCSAGTQDLVLQDLDRSIYQSYLVGYREGIYEGLEFTPSSIPVDLVEVWCRNRDDQDGIEAIMHYDRNLQKAVQRVYHSRKDPTGNYVQQMIPDFSVARVLTSNSVLIRDDKGFELTVYRDQPAPKIGLFIGQLKAVIDGKVIQHETYCRLGGSLDPSVWPAKPITGKGAYPQNLGTSPDGKYLAFMSAPGTSGRLLFVAKTDGSQPFQVNPPEVTPTVIGGGVAQAVFSEDSKSLFFHGTTPTPSLSYDHRLFKWDLDQPAGGAPERLALDTNKVNSFGLSGDQRSIVYEFDTNQRYAYTMRLKAMELSSGTIHNLTPAAASIYTRGIIGGFGVSKSLNKISYLWDASSSVDRPLLDYYSVNNDGTGLTKISPRLPSADWKLTNPERGFNIPNGGNYMMAKAILSTTQEVRYYAMALDGSGAIELPSGWTWSFLSSSSRFGFLTPKSMEETEATTVQALLMDFETGRKFPLPPLRTMSPTAYVFEMELWGGNLSIGTTVNSEQDQRLPNHPSIFFTSDSSQLIGRTPLPTGGFRAISVSTADGGVKDLCPGLVSEDLWVQSLSPGRSLVATYDSQTQFIDVYLHQANLGCRKVNSLLNANVSLQAIREIVISPDNQKLLIRISKRTSELDVTTHIFYVPLNGMPAYLVNYSLAASALALRATFTGDSQRVILLANQSTGTEVSVFIWQVPGSK